MELLAVVHSALAYDDPTPTPELRSLNTLLPSSAWMGLASLLVVSSVLAVSPNALALVQLGDNGTSVEAVQQALADAGFNPGGVDGVFGPQTDAAVREFQRSNQLEPDGIVGSRTATALGLGASEVASAGTNPSSRPATGTRPVLINGASPNGGRSPVSTAGTVGNADTVGNAGTVGTGRTTGTSTGTSTGASTGATTPTVTAIVAAPSGVRVRANPGISAEVIDSYDNGQTVSLTGETVGRDGYTWARLSGRDGWVAREFLSSGGATAARPTGTATTPSASVATAGTTDTAGTAGATGAPRTANTPVAARPGIAIVAADALIVRDGPNGTDTGNTLFRGERVSVTGQKVSRGGRDWMQLTNGGWVAAEYVSINSQS
ncbi:MAG TPA: peptidoglycan-binding protein [Chroococcidiopsis sp.]